MSTTCDIDYTAVDLAIELVNCVLADTLADALPTVCDHIKPCVGAGTENLIGQIIELATGVYPSSLEIKEYVKQIGAV
jgi:hypothetical protein